MLPMSPAAAAERSSLPFHGRSNSRQQPGSACQRPPERTSSALEPVENPAGVALGEDGCGSDDLGDGDVVVEPAGETLDRLALGDARHFVLAHGSCHLESVATKSPSLVSYRPVG